MASTQHTRDTSPKAAPKNGHAAALDDDDTEIETAPSTPVNTDGRVPGTIPTAPHAVLYQLEGRYFVAIHHPVNGSSFIVSAKGQGGAKGEAEDSGFLLNALKSRGPDWLRAKAPAGATVIGYAAIKSFPLPKQP